MYQTLRNQIHAKSDPVTVYMKMVGVKTWIQKNPGISGISSYSAPISMPHIIILKLQDIWLTRTLIREEGSPNFLQNLIPTNWENLQNKETHRITEKSKVKSCLRKCIPDPLNWVQTWKYISLDLLIVHNSLVLYLHAPNIWKNIYCKLLKQSTKYL